MCLIELMKKKILIYMIGSVGDTLISIPGIRAVKEYFGESCEYYLFSFKDSKLPFSFNHSFLVQLGFVNNLIYYESRFESVRGIGSLLKILSCLRSNSFYAVISLLPSGRSFRQIVRDRLFFYLAGIRRQIGFFCFSSKYKHPKLPNGTRGYSLREAQSKLIRLALDGVVSNKKIEDLGSIRSEVDSVACEKAALWLSQISAENKFVAIAPGTKQPSKQWPEDKFVELGNRILNRGAFKLIVLGADSEIDICHRLIKVWGGDNAYNACGHFDLIGTAKILSKCSLFIGLDSGLAHLAGALDIMNIVISSDHDVLGKWAVLSRNICLEARHPVLCGGCLLNVCVEPGHPCMKHIEVDEVFKQYLQLEAILLKT